MYIMDIKQELYVTVMKLFRSNAIKNQNDLDNLTEDCSDFAYDLMFAVMAVIHDELT